MEIKTDFKNINLKALNPIDIVLTKVARMWIRDAEDIEICIKKFKLTKKELELRAELIIYPGNEDQWKETLNRVIKEFT